MELSRSRLGLSAGSEGTVLERAVVSGGRSWVVGGIRQDPAGLVGKVRLAIGAGLCRREALTGEGLSVSGSAGDGLACRTAGARGGLSAGVGVNGRCDGSSGRRGLLRHDSSRRTRWQGVACREGREGGGFVGLAGHGWACPVGCGGFGSAWHVGEGRRDLRRVVGWDRQGMGCQVGTTLGEVASSDRAGLASDSREGMVGSREAPAWMVRMGWWVVTKEGGTGRRRG